MGYFKDVWSNLVLNTGRATSDLISSLNWRYTTNSGDLKYYSRSAYKYVSVHVAKQLAMSTLEGELKSLLPKYRQYVQKTQLDEVRSAQQSNRVTLINKGEASTSDFGFIEVPLSNANGELSTGSAQLHKVIAKTKYGRPVPEALILSYLGDSDITYTDTKWDRMMDWTKNPGTYSVRHQSTVGKIWNPKQTLDYNTEDGQFNVDDSFTTKSVIHIDLAPKVTMSSNKNLVMTTVQGRDFSRKELVSGGDMSYTINGSIVSDEAGVYPSEAVKRFVKIMQYNGMIDVNFITFGLLGIKQIIIKDFSLGNVECKNIQPYSFTCVAVEPDDDITLNADTITSVNNIILGSNLNTWYNTILENKLTEIAANSVTSAGVSSASAGLDALLTNI